MRWPAGDDADSRPLFWDHGEPGCPALMTYGCIRSGAPFLGVLSGSNGLIGFCRACRESIRKLSACTSPGQPAGIDDIYRRLGQSTCQPIRHVGKHPAETEPDRANLPQSYLYRARNLVEMFFNKIKQCRRVTLAANYLAFIKLASIRLWLRVNEFASLNH